MAADWPSRSGARRGVRRGPPTPKWRASRATRPPESQMRAKAPHRRPPSLARSASLRAACGARTAAQPSAYPAGRNAGPCPPAVQLEDVPRCAHDSPPVNPLSAFPPYRGRTDSIDKGVARAIGSTHRQSDRRRSVRRRPRAIRAFPPCSDPGREDIACGTYSPTAG